jgi:hypothetical protein
MPDSLDRALHGPYRALRRAPPAGKLRWAVAFASLRPDAILDRRERLSYELAGFLRIGLRARDGVPILFSEAEFRQAHERFTVLIREWLGRGEVRLGPIRSTLIAGLVRGRPYAVSRPDGDDVAAEAAQRLVLLLGEEGHRVKACRAPAAWKGRKDLCGRWFVGRPNKRHCSPACYNRAATRRFRWKRARSRG